MWLKAQNEMAGLWPHAAMGPVERIVRRHSLALKLPKFGCNTTDEVFRYALPVPKQGPSIRKKKETLP